jgi:hypothetical protein
MTHANKTAAEKWKILKEYFEQESERDQEIVKIKFEKLTFNACNNGVESCENGEY